MNHAEMQRENRSQVLQLLLENDGLSRAEIARMIGVQKGTITNIINEFEELGILYIPESERMNQRGQLLQIRIETLYIIVVAIDRREYRIRLYDLHGKVLHAVCHPVYRNKELLPQIEQMIEQIHEAAAIVGEEHIMGAMLAMPGPYVRNDHAIAYVSDFESLSMIDLREMLEERLPFPVISEHDAKLSAYAEWRHAKEMHSNPNASLAYIGSVGSGIGSGFVLHGGQVLLGQLGIASEIGHMGINFGGPPNEFSHNGTFEYYASADSLLRYLREMLPDYPDSSLKENSSNADILTAAQAGDTLGIALLDRLAKMLAYGIANLIFVINPDCIVLGTDYPDDILFLDRIREYLRGMVQPEILNPLILRYSTLQDDTVLRGGFEYALHRMTLHNTLYDRLSAERDHT